MTKRPTPLPRTYFSRVTKKTSDFHLDTQVDNAIKASHMERSSSLLMHKPQRPVPLPRSKSHVEPHFQNPGCSQSSQGQKNERQKDQRAEKPLDFGYQTLRPVRPPPPIPTKTWGGDKTPLPRKMSTCGPSGGYNTQDGDNKSNLKLFEEAEQKPSLPPPCSARIRPPPPPIPPPPGALYRSVSEQGQIPLYLEILPEETTTNEVTRSKAVHTFFSKRPLPPIPLTRCHSEPLREELSWSSCNQSVQKEDKIEDIDILIAWWNTAEQWENMPLDFGLKEEEETRVFTMTAYRVQMGLRFFHCLLSKNSEMLQNHITELNTIADNLDKIRKKAKIAAFTGGTTGVLGGVTALAGLVLAPLTMGASLVVMAVGVGVVAAGGVTGASASISSRVNSNLDRKKVEKIMLDYRSKVSDIERCLRFVDAGIERLRKLDVSRLKDVDSDTAAVARLAEDASSNISSIQFASQSVEILDGFSLGMDLFFPKGDIQFLKKGSETKFALEIRRLAQQLQGGLKMLMKVREVLSLAASTNGVYREQLSVMTRVRPMQYEMVTSLEN